MAKVHLYKKTQDGRGIITIPVDNVTTDELRRLRRGIQDVMWGNLPEFKVVRNGELIYHIDKTTVVSCIRQISNE